LQKSLLTVGIVVVLSTILFPFAAAAQSDKLGSWNIVTGMINPNNKFMYWFEAQTRSQQLTNDFYYHELKAGAAYNVSDKTQFFIGAGDYRTYTYPGNYEKPVTTHEYRTWEQLILRNQVDRVKIEHRYRVEQRWVNGDYRNRFRYRIYPIVPINHSKLIPKTVYLTAFEEVFFTNTAPYFERNRFLVGAGYQFSGLFCLQMGFIRQFDYNTTNNGVGKNFIQTNLFLYLDKHTLSKNVERSPSSID
jgi:hypothetical protein